MINIVSLFVVAALVSMQYGFVANAQIDSPKLDIDNNLQPNVVPVPISPARRPRRLRNFVKIGSPPPATARFSTSPLELSCEVTGAPMPSVQWLKNGQPLDDVYYEQESNELVTIHPQSLATAVSTLLITSPSPNPEDVYTCVAISGLKEATASTKVYNTDNPELYLQNLFSLASKPRITLYYSYVLVPQRTDVVLPCRINNYANAQVFWMDNDEKVVYGDSRMRVLPSGDLLINELRWSDMGEFKCTVKNYHGEDTATTFVYPTKV